jgi:hypothetical protein
MYLSNLLGSPATTTTGEPLGRVWDVVTDVRKDAPAPVLALLLRSGKAPPLAVPLTAIQRQAARGIVVAVTAARLERFLRSPGELLLARDVLDRLVIDLDHGRAVRANDAVLAAGPDGWHLQAIDVGVGGVLRRWGLRALADRWGTRGFVPWECLVLLDAALPSEWGRRLNRLTAPAIARILETVPISQGAPLLASLEPRLAAQAVAAVPTRRRAALVGSLDFRDAVQLREELTMLY